MDRNTSIDNLTQGVFKSLSARRAWIETRMALFPAPPTMVALRKESVDRNRIKFKLDFVNQESLSARRAWIETPLGGPRAHSRAVALRKESVDRN